MDQESVTSRDGTPIAYWRSGDGPPLVLVHGTAADHSRWAPVLPAFEQRFTVCAIDRRGRGGSGDADDYARRAGVRGRGRGGGLPGGAGDLARPLATGRCARSRPPCSAPERPRRWCSTSPRSRLAGAEMQPSRGPRAARDAAAGGRPGRGGGNHGARDRRACRREMVESIALPARVASAGGRRRTRSRGSCERPRPIRFDPERFGELAVPTLLLTGSEKPGRRCRTGDGGRGRGAAGLPPRRHGRAGARGHGHRDRPLHRRGPPVHRRSLTVRGSDPDRRQPHRCESEHEQHHVEPDQPGLAAAQVQRDRRPAGPAPSPTAAASASPGATPVRGGRTRPSAPSTSSTPMVRVSGRGTASIPAHHRPQPVLRPHDLDPARVEVEHRQQSGDDPVRHDHAARSGSGVLVGGAIVDHSRSPYKRHTRVPVDSEVPVSDGDEVCLIRGDQRPGRPRAARPHRRQVGPADHRHAARRAAAVHRAAAAPPRASPSGC